MKEPDKPRNQSKLIKQLNQELKQVTYVAMLPGVDLTGDYTSEDEVRKAKESFNRSPQNANLFHVEMTDTFEVIESYLAPVDMRFDTVMVNKGSWLITLQIKSNELWEMVKSGEINGISIGAMAQIEEYEEGDYDD
jgi:hypothetical protein